MQQDLTDAVAWAVKDGIADPTRNFLLFFF
jgi:dipeptidyl aminopeptidase/acylaminoacyl peptidase